MTARQVTSPQFEKLVGILHERRRVDTTIPVAVLRAGMEAVALPLGEGVRVEPIEAGGPPGDWLVPEGVAERGVLLYLHGGGYVMGSPTTHRKLAGDVCRATGTRTLVLAYRLAPEHPHPAALDDAVAAYRWLVNRSGDAAAVGIVGDSAGGGLTIATLLALRDAGEPLPAVAGCISPWADLDLQQVVSAELAARDPVVSIEELRRFRDWYVADQDPRHPVVSPVYADLEGLPPMLIHVGDAEVLLDDSRRLHERALAAGVDATLEVGPDMIHVWHVFAGRVPESTDAVARLGAFVRSHLSHDSRAAPDSPRS